MISPRAHERPVLCVELRARHGARTIEFLPSGPTTLSVGAGTACDVWLNGAAVPLVCFHLVRSGRSLSLVPADRCSGLTVNASPVREAIELPQRAIVEIGDERVYVTTFEAGFDPDTSRVAAPDISDLPTQVIPVCAVTEPIPTRVFSRNFDAVPPEPHRTPVDDPLLHTSRLTAGGTRSEEVTGTLAPSVLAPNSEVITLRVPVTGAPASPPLQAMPVIGVGTASLRAGPTPGPSSRPNVRETPERPTHAPFEGRQPRAASSSTPKSQPPRNRVLRAVTQLGLRAKAEPRKVFGAALLVGILVSLTLAGMARALSRRPAPALPPAVSALPPASVTREAPPRPLESTRPPPVVVRAASAPMADATSRRATDALRHLVAGREADARAAYARLASELPPGTAYAAVAKLLERRATPQCNGPLAREPPPASCPELKR